MTSSTPTPDPGASTKDDRAELVARLRADARSMAHEIGDPKKRKHHALIHEAADLIERLQAVSAPPADVALHIVFDGPPDHDGPRFIEVEDPQGRSVNAGEWRQRPDGFWELVILRQDALTPPASPADQWRSDMENAPKDGRQVLLWTVHQNAKYSKDPVGEGWACHSLARWIEHNGGGWTWNGLCGVHVAWAALPPPPADQGAED